VVEANLEFVRSVLLVSNLVLTKLTEQCIIDG
jgi:hypothetical protein